MFYQLLEMYCATCIFALTLHGCPVSASSTGGTEVTQTMPEWTSVGMTGGLGSLRLCPHVQENQLPPEKFTAMTSGNGPKHPLTHQQHNTESR